MGIPGRGTYFKLCVENALESQVYLGVALPVDAAAFPNAGVRFQKVTVLLHEGTEAGAAYLLCALNAELDLARQLAADGLSWP